MVIKKHDLFLTESPSSFRFKRCLFTNLPLSTFKVAWSSLTVASVHSSAQCGCNKTTVGQKENLG